MQKITLFSMMCLLGTAFAMKEDGGQKITVPIPFKKKTSFLTKVAEARPFQNVDKKAAYDMVKKAGKAALYLSAVLVPSMYSDVTIDFVSQQLAELGMSSMETMIPAIVHSADTLIASVAGLKCAELFSSERLARLSGSILGGLSALGASGQLASLADIVPSVARRVSDAEIEAVLNNL